MIQKNILTGLLICLAFCTTTIHAGNNHSHAAIEISATDAWTRETPPGVTTTAIYLTIANKSTADIKLIAATTEVSNRVELHTHKMQGDLMKMEKIDAITIPADSKASLMPHGDHIMLFNLDVALKEGEVVTIELSFDNGQSLRVDAPVNKQPPTAMHMHNKHKDMTHDKSMNH